MKLVVTQPFADFKVGDSITKSEDVQAYLDSHPGSVVKAPDDPKPDAAPAPAEPPSDTPTFAPRGMSRRG
jgi:hypothetical protein